MMAQVNLKAAIIAGTAAGVVSGLVKLGWENILPPRTAARNQTNPPQRLLEQAGVPAAVTHATYTYSGEKLPWVSYLIHFGFSTTFGVLYSVAGHYAPSIRTAQGTLFGLGVWGHFISVSCLRCRLSQVLRINQPKNIFQKRWVTWPGCGRITLSVMNSITNLPIQNKVGDQF